MSFLRATGVALLTLVAFAFMAFGVDDVLMSQLPPMHQDYGERHGLVASEPVVVMVLSVFAGQGGFFFGSGLALLLLAVGPVRRGEPFASGAALALVVFGNAGIVLALHRLGAPFSLLRVLLVLGVAGVAACWVASRAAAAGAQRRRAASGGIDS
jgi:hypothetical protein